MGDVTFLGADPVELAAWMASLGIEFSGPLRLRRLGIGQSNLTFHVGDRDGRSWVLRRPPLGRLLASAHDVAREARILSALERTPVPAPRVHGVRTGGDAPLVLMEFVDGLVIDRPIVAESLPPDRRRAVGLAMAGTLAKIHAVDLDETGLTDLARHGSYAERQLNRWFVQWEKSRTRDLPALVDLTERLLAAVPVQRETTLVHGDFHLGNVIASPDDGRIFAVLDWELCTLGDPLADLGSLLAYWPESAGALGVERSATALPGFPTQAEMAAAYLEATGRDPGPLPFWHALALWKLAVIAEGVLRRALDDPRNRAAAGVPTVRQIDALVAEATAIADAAGVPTS
ncbi:phosphotransferase family protein [Spirillospora sp. NPDC048819]|uniref:phosphotransferase family protein n=1 Tax=Spirillospora sp. NPDC048819 TaxID=3155268 RepID=UPI0033E26102